MSTPGLFEVTTTALQVQYTTAVNLEAQISGNTQPRCQDSTQENRKAKWSIWGLNQYHKMLKELSRFEHAAQTQEVSLLMIA